jgi:chitin synthase
LQWRRPRSPQVNYRDGNFRLEKKSEEEGGVGSGDRSSRAFHPPKHWQRVILTVFGFSGVWASCAISAIVSLTTELPWFQALCLPACLCLLSLCWYPKVQVYTVRSSDGTFQGRWKASCMYTLFKIIILCIGLSLVMALRMREHGVLDKNFFVKLYDGIYACRHKEIFYPLLIHFSSSFTIHTIGYVATALCMPGTVIGVASVIATPVSCAGVIFFCLWGGAWLDDGMCLYDSVGIWCACVLAALTFFAPFVIRRRLLYPNAGIVLKPYDELFIQPTWNSIFIEQHMCLNYKHDGFSGHDHVIMPPDKKVNNRIYICTTMYREADIEMGRLLRSLNKVSQSTKMKNTYFEAHIFMDNGTSDLHLTDFASQLISLLEDKMGVTAKDANAFMTPYGVQLNWILPKGMPFFIHLKDSAKVKPKKRWSQVMYMSYVLNFRNVRETRLTLRNPDEPPMPDSFIDDSLFVGYSSDKEWEKNNSALTTTKKHVSASASSLDLSDKERPEPRSKVHKWYPTPASPDTGASVVTNTTSMTSISSILNTFSAELIHHTSSDQVS